MAVLHVHEGYTFADMTARMDDGRYRACIAIIALDAGQTRAQRFLDLETFQNEADARSRALAAAKEWVGSERGQDRLGLPTQFASTI